MKTSNRIVAGSFFFFIILSALSMAAYSGGSGTSLYPYKIATAADWETLMKTSGDWNAHFILWANINLYNVTITPVGNGSTPFTGVFDGNNKTISKATINTPSGNYVGLFGYIYNTGEIKELTVSGVNMQGNLYVGGLAGYNSGTLTSCYVTGTVSGVAYVGKLVGYNHSGSFTACHTAGAVSGNNYVGGLVGHNINGSLTVCYSTCTVSGLNLVSGGLVGNSYGTLTSCYATGTVNGNYSAGGLVGENGGTITSSYATGAVSGDDYVGGLVGKNSDTISNCYATGDVTGTEKIGGFAGLNDQAGISYCYSVGTPTGTSSVGGFCGLANIGGAYADTCNYWDTETSGFSASAMGTGKTTSEMQTLLTFVDCGWDFFAEIDPADWQMPPSSYPHLIWENLTYCGDGGHPYPTGDSNQDCRVDLADFAALADHWLECTALDCG
jgi:hypothetical protein